MTDLHFAYTNFGRVDIVNSADVEPTSTPESAPTPQQPDNRSVREVMAELEGCDPDDLLWLELPAPIVLMRLWRWLDRRFNVRTVYDE